MWCARLIITQQRQLFHDRKLKYIQVLRLRLKQRPCLKPPLRSKQRPSHKLRLRLRLRHRLKLRHSLRPQLRRQPARYLLVRLVFYFN